MPDVKMKFNVTNLLGKAEARREREKTDHAKRLAKYERDMERLRPKIADALADARMRVEGGEYPEIGGYEGKRNLTVPLSFKVPAKPQLEEGRWEDLIYALRETTDETVKLDARELAYYDLDI